MHIQSITARNYRIHRDVTVELDPARTLVGGPNEVGKSTLVEAAHRALFLKAKITGETQRSMVSNVHAGHPEVEVCFRAGDKDYRIAKRFSGANGTAALTEIGGPNWQGEEAESRLAEILGVDPVGGGRGAGDRAAEQWGHLWVWQGKAGDDPSGHANAQIDSLIERLQEHGGAAVLQSARDTEVSNRVTSERDAIFNKNGTPKRDSDLGRAELRQAETAAALAAAGESLRRLEQAMADFQEADSALQTAAQEAKDLAAQLDETETKLARVAKLEGEEKPLRLDAEAKAKEHGALRDADANILEKSAKIAHAEKLLGPNIAKTAAFEAAHDAARKALLATDVSVKKTDDDLQAIRSRHEQADVRLKMLERSATLDGIRSRHAKIAATRAKLQDLRGALDKLPKIGPADIKALQRLEAAHSNAGASLKAMATGIAIRRADRPIRIGAEELGPGDSRILTDDCEIAIGPDICLRIMPGGGVTLAAARQSVHDAKAALDAFLKSKSVESSDDAAAASTKRGAIEAEIGAETARLKALGGDSIDRDLADAERQFAAAEREFAAKSSGITGVEIPSDIAGARELLAATKAELDGAIERHNVAKAARAAALETMKSAEATLAEHRSSIGQDTLALKTLQAELGALVGIHGDDAARSARRNALREASEAAKKSLEETSAALEALQPAVLKADWARLKRALEKCGERRTDAIGKRAAAEAILRNDGSADPLAAMAAAAADDHLGRARLESARRRAEAIRLLADLFAREQEALAAQFTQPLADKVSGYLECLFGPGTRAAVNKDGDGFTGLRVSRATHAGGAALEFSALSGGAREQVAAGFRLAVAELLAEQHGGTLPLVFDDAFAYSDPDRINILQRMLEHGANRGLQIIVLTCNPRDYCGLGAKLIELRPILPPAGTAQPAPVTVPPDTGPAPEPTGDSRSVPARDGGRSANLHPATHKTNPRRQPR